MQVDERITVIIAQITAAIAQKEEQINLNARQRIESLALKTISDTVEAIAAIEVNFSDQKTTEEVEAYRSTLIEQVVRVAQSVQVAQQTLRREELPEITAVIAQKQEQINQAVNRLNFLFNMNFYGYLNDSRTRAEKMIGESQNNHSYRAAANAAIKFIYDLEKAKDKILQESSKPIGESKKEFIRDCRQAFDDAKLDPWWHFLVKPFLSEGLTNRLGLFAPRLEDNFDKAVKVNELEPENNSGPSNI